MFEKGDFPSSLFTALLFMQIGPIALIPLFDAVTADETRATRIKIAFLSAALGFATLLLAMFLVVPVMGNWRLKPPTLIMAAGLVLTLTALRTLFFTPVPPVVKASGLAKAFTPIAIPGMVSPVAVAVIATFISYFPGSEERTTIITIMLAIFSANIFAMLIARTFMRYIGMAPLTIFSAIFGILQVALGLQMIAGGVARLIQTY